MSTSTMEEKMDDSSSYVALDAETAAMRSKLSPDQLRILEIIQVEKKNVFMHGGPGTGKSYVIQQLVRENPDFWTVTAPSGCAAARLPGGCTLQSVLGVMICKTFEDAWNRVSANKWVRRKLFAMRGLIIDEISMCDARLIIIADLILRTIKNSPDVPFGGVQVLLGGDFLQLPPVWTDTPEDRPWKNCFAFHAFPFMNFNPMRCDLTTVFRQTDPQFLELLRNARLGRLTTAGRQLLTQCRNRKLPPGIDPTELMTSNKKVDACNLARMSKHPVRVKFKPLTCKKVKVERLPSSGRRALRIVPWSSSQQERDALKRFMGFMRLDSTLVLCLNACVLLRANAGVERGFANGSTGKIEGFIPRKLVYPTGGLPEFCLKPLLSNENVITQDKELAAAIKAKTKLLPVVKFATHISLVAVGEYRYENGGNVIYTIPLKLAWAMTVDRAQGATMQFVRMSLKFGLRDGVGNVAISRVTSPEGLQLVDERIPQKPFLANQVALKYFGQPVDEKTFGQPFQWPKLGNGTALAREWEKASRLMRSVVKNGKGGQGKTWKRKR